MFRTTDRGGQWVRSSSGFWFGRGGKRGKNRGERRGWVGVSRRDHGILSTEPQLHPITLKSSACGPRRRQRERNTSPPVPSAVGLREAHALRRAREECTCALYSPNPARGQSRSFPHPHPTHVPDPHGAAARRGGSAGGAGVPPFLPLLLLLLLGGGSPG